MPSLREISLSVYGAFLLLRFDARGLGFFEDSVAAFWRSFFAAAIVAPGYLALTAMHLAQIDAAAGALPTLVVESAAYVILWTALPLLLYYIALAIGREDRFLIAVIALNWSSVIQIMLSLPAHMIAQGEVLPPVIANLLGLGVFVVLLVYEWFVARTALRVASLGAAGIVALDVFLSFAVRGAADGLLR